MLQVNQAVQAQNVHAQDYPGLQPIGIAATRVVAALAASLKKG